MSDIKPLVFDDKSSLVERELAIILGQISHHIHPKIVRLITHVNEKFKKEFAEKFPSLLDSNVFFMKIQIVSFLVFDDQLIKKKKGQNSGKIKLMKRIGQYLMIIHILDIFGHFYL